jgi:F0F1-type ATP synthase alpha subunit
MDFTIIVSATAADSAAAQYIAPYAVVLSGNFSWVRD